MLALFTAPDAMVLTSIVAAIASVLAAHFARRAGKAANESADQTKTSNGRSSGQMIEAIYYMVREHITNSRIHPLASDPKPEEEA